jgi:hypothetical protein
VLRRAIATAGPKGSATASGRPRVLCCEMLDDHHDLIGDITDQGFVLAAGKLVGDMRGFPLSAGRS